jgi:hypothetical protein
VHDISRNNSSVSNNVASKKNPNQNDPDSQRPPNNKDKNNLKQINNNSGPGLIYESLDDENTMRTNVNLKNTLTSGGGTAAGA